VGWPKSILPFQPLSHSDIIGILVVLIDCHCWSQMDSGTPGGISSLTVRQTVI